MSYVYLLRQMETYRARKLLTELSDAAEVETCTKVTTVSECMNPLPSRSLRQ